jgi:hypothetical protein
MMKWLWTTLVALPVAIVGSLVYATAQGEGRNVQDVEGFVCPITGEELPCPDCCPLNKSQ